jgi:hypothetical protein
MGRFMKLLLAAGGALSLIGAGSATVLAHESSGLVEFDSMTPVAGAAVGPATDRGIVGGGLPWAITSGEGSVDRHGEVEVTVKRLVIPNPPPASGITPGTNPVKMFEAVVSCLTRGGTPINTHTKPFPASLAGDSTIEDTVALPRHCKDPIVFVVAARPDGSAGPWFAKSNPNGDEEGVR